MGNRIKERSIEKKVVEHCDWINGVFYSLSKQKDIYQVTVENKDQTLVYRFREDQLSDVIRDFNSKVKQNKEGYENLKHSIFSAFVREYMYR